MAISRVHTWSAGEVLSALDLNTEINNILNNSTDLVFPITKSISLGGFTLYFDATQIMGMTYSTKGINLSATTAINETLTTVASATTPDIWTGVGNVVSYTGTVTATGFAAAPQAGARRTLYCVGAAPFTAGANVLIDGYLSGNTYTATAGDKVEVIALTTTQFNLLPSNQGSPVFASFTATTANITTANITTANITTANITTLAGTTSVNGGQIAGRRNAVINGNGLIQQLPTAPTLTAALQYGLADMHLIGVTSGTGVSGTVGVLSNTGFSCGVGYGAIAASWTTGQFIYKTRMPGINTKRFNSKTVVVSGNIYQDTGGSRNITVSLGKPTTTLDTFSAVTNLGTSSAIPVATATVTPFSYSLALGSTDASLGIEILITDNAANTVSSKNYAISDLQFELGSTATTFEQPDEFLELQICRSFLPVIRCAGSGAIESLGISTNYSTTVSHFVAQFPPTRARITGIAVSSVTKFFISDVVGGVIATTNVTFGAGNGSFTVGDVLFTVAAGLTTGQSPICGFDATATSSDYIAFTGAQL